MVLFLLLVLAAGITGYGILTRLGLDQAEAVASGLAAGLVAVVLPAWWLGSLVAGLWATAAAAALAVGCGAGLATAWRRRPRPSVWLPPAAVVLSFSLVVLFIRLPHPEIEQQEKLMDLGILASLVRTEAFPPPDMWLAGENLPYYYLGSLLWATPLRLSGLPLEIGYNLVVALLAGAAAGCLWAVGRRLGGGAAAGLTAAAFALLAGTPDGLRQLLAGRAPWGLDFWASSRQVPETITEFPLFTLWLGDLHPHLLSIPIAVLALLLAAETGRRGAPVALVAATAVAVGVTWAANPWAMPPTLVAVWLLLLCDDGAVHWPVGVGRRRWLAAVAVAVGAWLATAPFHLDFHPPFDGIALVRAWTQPTHLLLYAGALVVPALAVAVATLRRRLAGQGPTAARALTVSGAAVVVMAAAASGRPTLVLLAAGLIAVGAEVLRSNTVERRPSLALAALGLFLFVVPEVVYVVDSYGDALHRMNTVFKAYIQGWVLLALALPGMLRSLPGSELVKRGWLAGLVVVSIPHFLSAVAGPLRSGAPGLDGLRWMDRGDRELVAALRAEAPGASLIEAVGPAYSRHARLSAASGVPAFLGWANHELVWRGSGISQETGRREQLVRELYRSDDPRAVRRLVAQAGVDLVAVGSLELVQASPAAVDAIRRAGDVVLESDGALLVRFSGDGTGPTEEGG